MSCDVVDQRSRKYCHAVAGGAEGGGQPVLSATTRFGVLGAGVSPLFGVCQINLLPFTLSSIRWSLFVSEDWLCFLFLPSFSVFFFFFFGFFAGEPIGCQRICEHEVKYQGVVVELLGAVILFSFFSPSCFRSVSTQDVGAHACVLACLTAHLPSIPLGGGSYV